MKRPVLAALSLTVFAACVAGITLGLLSLRPVLPGFRGFRTGTTLTPGQRAAVRAAISLMQRRGLSDDAALASALLRQGLWRVASPDDPYLAQSERAGDTPYAYTLANGREILAVVLASRFFTDTTPTARAALMVHELGHVHAYQRTGRSDEYDGYKHEYDTHTTLGLTQADGLTYFAMLDGVVQYVVPRAPAYKSRPDVKSFLAESGDG